MGKLMSFLLMIPAVQNKAEVKGNAVMWNV